MSLTIRLPEDISCRLSALAKETGRTKSFYAREALLRHLENMEDVYLAEKRIEELRAGRVQAIPLEDVMKRYDMES